MRVCVKKRSELRTETDKRDLRRDLDRWIDNMDGRDGVRGDCSYRTVLGFYFKDTLF